MEENDPEYSERRAKNNEAVKKSRAKSKKQFDGIHEKLVMLQEENKQLIQSVTNLSNERDLLKRLFTENAGSTSGIKLTAEQIQLLQEPPLDIEEMVQSLKYRPM